MRINKFLSSCGVASRRKCDEYIVAGLVKVNGGVVASLGLDIDEKKDIVEFNGEIVKLNEDKVYYIFNKPKGCVTTSSDDRGRKTVLDYFANIDKRLFCVGRLDYNTTGLLLLTNDGDFSQAIMHPSKCIKKTYKAKIRGVITESEIKKLENGVLIDGKKTAPAKIEIIEQKQNVSILNVTIIEGRNREVRKMLETVNKMVIDLERIKIGSLELGDLPRGKYKKIDYKIAKKSLTN